VARPKQARSEQTLYRLLDAAEALIEEKGLGDVSVPAIVARAGSSVGGFYARFRDKNELLRALEERFFLELVARLEAISDPERWGDAPVAEIVAVCAEELVSVAQARRALLEAFLIRAVRDPEFRREGLRFRQRVSKRMTALLLTRRAEIAHPDPELAIDLGVQLAFGLLQQKLIFGELRAAGREVGDPEIVRELTRSFLGYLGVASPAASTQPVRPNGDPKP
jgi:AcrR family transcriptional regulator